MQEIRNRFLADWIIRTHRGVFIFKYRTKLVMEYLFNIHSGPGTKTDPTKPKNQPRGLFFGDCLLQFQILLANVNMDVE